MCSNCLTIFNNITLRFFTIYTISSLFNSTHIIPILSLLLGFNYSIYYVLVTLYIYFFNSNCLLASFLIEYIELLNNPITNWLLRKLYIWSYNHYLMLFAINTYNYQLIFFFLYIGSTKLFFPQNFYILLSFLITDSVDYIYLYLMIFGFFSNYHFIHLFCLILFFYFAINIINIPKVKLSPLVLTIVEDYPHLNIVPTDNLKIQMDELEIDDFIII